MYNLAIGFDKRLTQTMIIDNLTIVKICYAITVLFDSYLRNYTVYNYLLIQRYNTYKCSHVYNYRYLLIF